MTGRALILTGLLVFCAGCGRHNGLPPAGASGTVDLDRLMRLDPSYAATAGYDRAIADLRLAVRETSTTLPAGSAQYTLPPLALPAEAARPVGLAGLARRLQESKRREMDSLRELRVSARRRQIRREAVAIAKDAQTAYAADVARIEQQYRSDIQRVAGQQEARRVNLKLQIHALEVLLSKLPPKGPDSAPRPQADAAQRALADRQAELAAVDSDLRGLLATVDSQRDERLQAARRGMQDRIDNTLASREQELLAADNVQLAREASQIDRQIRTLMTRASTLASSQAAQPERRLGPVTVDVAAPPASAMSGVDASIAALGREKQRWIQYVRDEARMAALDVAAQKRWSISFAPGRGEHDLTGPVADTLKAGAWRS